MVSCEIQIPKVAILFIYSRFVLAIEWVWLQKYLDVFIEDYDSKFQKVTHWLPIYWPEPFRPNCETNLLF